MVLMI